jgi:hypothetical protein
VPPDGDLSAFALLAVNDRSLGALEGGIGVLNGAGALRVR